MIIFSIGLPSAFTSWCDSLVLDLARRALGDAELIGADTLDAIARQMIGMPVSHFVIGARQPSARLREVLRERDCRFVLSPGDPASVVAEIVATRGQSIASAVRAVASSVATVTRYAALPGALVLRDCRGDPLAALDVARAVDRHFGFNLPERELVAATGRGPAEDFRLADPEGWWHRVSPDDRALVVGALDGFRDYAANGYVGQLTWERALFSLADRAGEPAVEAIDMTGRARCLFYGPYIVLPAGSWTAHVVLVCSREAAGMNIFIEVTTGSSSLASTQLSLERAGVFEAVIDFVIDESAENSVEVRVFNSRAAFDGLLGLGRVVLVPRLPIVGDHRANVAAELGIDVG